MKDIQAEIWNSIHSNLRDHPAICDSCNTPRMLEEERLYDDMCERFEETLNGAQKQAFCALMDLTAAVIADNKERGIALGFNLSKELNAFMNNPTNAMHRANLEYTPVPEASKDAVQRITRYFWCVDGADHG